MQAFTWPSILEGLQWTQKIVEIGLSVTMPSGTLLCLSTGEAKKPTIEMSEPSYGVFITQEKYNYLEMKRTCVPVPATRTAHSFVNDGSK